MFKGQSNIIEYLKWAEQYATTEHKKQVFLPDPRRTQQLRSIDGHIVFVGAYRQSGDKHTGFAVTGDTYPVREQLTAIGMVWNDSIKSYVGQSDIAAAFESISSNEDYHKHFSNWGLLWAAFTDDYYGIFTDEELDPEEYARKQELWRYFYASIFASATFAIGESVVVEGMPIFSTNNDKNSWYGWWSFSTANDVSVLDFPSNADRAVKAVLELCK